MVKTVQVAKDRVNSAELEQRRLVKAGSGQLIGLMATNAGAVDAWLQLHDKASTNGITAPIFTMKLKAGESVEISTPVKFTTGLVVALSSTPGAFGDSTDNESGWFLAQVL